MNATLMSLYAHRSTLNTKHAPALPPLPIWNETLHPELVGTVVTLTDSAIYKAGTKVTVTNAVLQHGIAQYDCEYVFKYKRKTCVSRFTARQQDILELQQDSEDVAHVPAKKRTSPRSQTLARGRVIHHE